MNTEAAAAIEIIRKCLESERYSVTRRLAQRMGEIGIMWRDITDIFDAPADVRDGGSDPFGRRKWIVAGDAGEGSASEFLCAIDHSETVSSVSVTIDWEA